MMTLEIMTLIGSVASMAHLGLGDSQPVGLYR